MVRSKSYEVFLWVGDEVVLVLIHLRVRLIAECGQKFEVNYPLLLDVSHRPCRHLVLTPRPSNVMGVRALQK